MDGLSDLLSAADDLYGLLPEAFTIARDERVRELRRSGATARALAVQGLRRPCVAAWLVNALVRHRKEQIERLLAVGQALREAQDGLDSAQLRELGRQRQAVLTAITNQARVLAAQLGRPVREQVLADVEETLRAALADQTAANAVRAGRLTGPLRYTGFGDGTAQVEVNDVDRLRDRDPDRLPAAGRRRMVAPRPPAGTEGPGSRDPAAGPAADPAALHEAIIAVASAQDAAQQAEGAAMAAENHRDLLANRARTAQERLEAAHAELAKLESLLATARVATSTAAAAWAPLHAEADAAAARAVSARRLADTAHALLTSARAHLATLQESPEEDREPARTGS